MAIKQLSLGCLAFFGLTIGLSAIAQDQPDNDGVAQVFFLTPQDGQRAALEKAVTSYHHFMGDKEGSRRYQWYEILTGEDTGKYLTRSGDHNWADFDAKHDWDAAAGEKFASEVAPLVAHARAAYTVRRPQWGKWPESMQGYTLFNVTHWYILPGQQGAFSAAMDKVSAALNKSDFDGYAAFEQVVTGGHGTDYVYVVPYKNFADMAPQQPDFMDALAKGTGSMEAAGQLMAELGATFKVGESYLLRYRPDLSDYGDMDN